MNTDVGSCKDAECDRWIARMW